MGRGRGRPAGFAPEHPAYVERWAERVSRSKHECGATLDGDCVRGLPLTTLGKSTPAVCVCVCSPSAFLSALLSSLLVPLSLSSAMCTPVTDVMPLVRGTPRPPIAVGMLFLGMTFFAGARGRVLAVIAPCFRPGARRAGGWAIRSICPSLIFTGGVAATAGSPPPLGGGVAVNLWRPGA